MQQQGEKQNYWKEKVFEKVRVNIVDSKGTRLRRVEKYKNLCQTLLKQFKCKQFITC